jgi:hypothetical protein
MTELRSITQRLGMSDAGRLRPALRILVAALLALPIAVAASAPAQAATAGSCSGTIVSGGRVQLKTSSGTTVGEIIVYYQSSNGGTNTACLYHRGPAYNVYRQTMIQLGECIKRDCTYAFDGGFYMRDEGNYKKYAGPVQRTTTNGNCVVAEGSIVWGGHEIARSTGRVGCG